MPTNRGLSKTGLIRVLAARLDINLKESGALVDAFLETMTEALTDGDRIVMGGFGVLIPVMRGGKRGRNPKTGEEVAVPPHRGVVFHMASGLMASLNRECPHGVRPRCAGGGGFFVPREGQNPREMFIIDYNVLREKARSRLRTA